MLVDGTKKSLADKCQQSTALSNMESVSTSTLSPDTGYCSEKNVVSCDEAKIEPLISVASQTSIRAGAHISDLIH